MFETELEKKLMRIFELKKVSYDEPGPAREQDCLFLDIEESRNTIKDGQALAKVTGSGVFFATNDKIKFGFFSKAIQQADVSDTKDLFFESFETNTKLYRNIVQRSFSFVYFFKNQYDPELGTITSVELEEQ